MESLPFGQIWFLVDINLLYQRTNLGVRGQVLPPSLIPFVQLPTSPFGELQPSHKAMADKTTDKMADKQVLKVTNSGISNRGG